MANEKPHFFATKFLNNFNVRKFFNNKISSAAGTSYELPT